MRRRDFTMGLLLASTIGAARAQQPTKQHRIAIVVPAGPVVVISETSGDTLSRRLYQPFFEELRRLGDVEGQNLTIERYSGEGRPEGFADLAREVVNRRPDVIVAISYAFAAAAHAAAGTTPIVATLVDPIEARLATSLARPGSNITGVTVFAGAEIWGKRLQILKEAVPSASKVAYLDMRSSLESAASQQGREERRKASRLLEISMTDMLLQEATPAEVQRVFAEIPQERPDAVMVSGTGDLLPYRQLIVELVEKNRLPAIYGWRNYVEAGGLMSYSSDLPELGRRIADDVHEILNGTKPGDIPIYQPTKYELVINLKTAKTLGLTIPPTLLGVADEVIEWGGAISRLVCCSRPPTNR